MFIRRAFDCCRSNNLENETICFRAREEFKKKFFRQGL